jgi:hypothetical protein
LLGCCGDIPAEGKVEKPKILEQEETALHFSFFLCIIDKVLRKENVENVY